jgi:hypothetical protein
MQSHSAQSAPRDKLQEASESDTEPKELEEYFGVSVVKGVYPATIQGLCQMEETWSDEIEEMLLDIQLALATHQARRMQDPTGQLKNIEQLTYWRNTLIGQRAKACQMREVLQHNASPSERSQVEQPKAICHGRPYREHILYNMKQGWPEHAWSQGSKGKGDAQSWQN